MYKFKMYLSSFLLILNPICGFLMFCSPFLFRWWSIFIIPCLIWVVYLTLSFYFRAHKWPHLRSQIKNDKILKEAGWEHIWTNTHDDEEIYRNIKTCEVSAGGITKDGKFITY